jgi:hypothetical protein
MIVLGILLILVGLEVILYPVAYNPIYQYTFDLRGYNIPFGIFMILVGIRFLWISWTSRKKKQK